MERHVKDSVTMAAPRQLGGPLCFYFQADIQDAFAPQAHNLKICCFPSPKRSDVFVPLCEVLNPGRSLRMPSCIHWKSLQTVSDDRAGLVRKGRTGTGETNQMPTVSTHCYQDHNDQSVPLSTSMATSNQKSGNASLVPRVFGQPRVET